VPDKRAKKNMNMRDQNRGMFGPRGGNATRGRGNVRGGDRNRGRSAPGRPSGGGDRSRERNRDRFNNGGGGGGRSTFDANGRDRNNGPRVNASNASYAFANQEKKEENKSDATVAKVSPPAQKDTTKKVQKVTPRPKTGKDGAKKTAAASAGGNPWAKGGQNKIIAQVKDAEKKKEEAARQAERIRDGTVAREQAAARLKEAKLLEAKKQRELKKKQVEDKKKADKAAADAVKRAQADAKKNAANSSVSAARKQAAARMAAANANKNAVNTSSPAKGINMGKWATAAAPTDEFSFGAWGGDSKDKKQGGTMDARALEASLRQKPATAKPKETSKQTPLIV
jgi:colicin import membrane protein